MKRIVLSLAAAALMLALAMGLNAPAFAAGHAPTAENLELTTLRGRSVQGQLQGRDPDGGALQYVISTRPVKGEIVLEADGSFVYTPRAKKRGRDYFGYRAVDEEGLQSQEATAIIRIEKPNSQGNTAVFGESES